MIKKLFLILFLLTLALNSSAMSPVLLQAITDTGSECTKTYEPSVTVDSNFSVGRYTTEDYVGLKYTAQSTSSVCKIDVWVSNINNDPTGNNYYAEIYALDGNDLNSRMGVSDAVAGASVSDDAYLSFIFSTPVALTATTTYGIVLFIDQDSGLEDDPENDGTNYWEWGFDDEAGADSAQVVRAWWVWDAAIPYSYGGQDVDDLYKIRVYTQ